MSPSNYVACLSECQIIIGQIFSSQANSTYFNEICPLFCQNYTKSILDSFSSNSFIQISSLQTQEFPNQPLEASEPIENPDKAIPSEEQENGQEKKTEIKSNLKKAVGKIKEDFEEQEVKEVLSRTQVIEHPSARRDREDREEEEKAELEAEKIAEHIAEDAAELEAQLEALRKAEEEAERKAEEEAERKAEEEKEKLERKEEDEDESEEMKDEDEEKTEDKKEKEEEETESEEMEDEEKEENEEEDEENEDNQEKQEDERFEREIYENLKKKMEKLREAEKEENLKEENEKIKGQIQTIAKAFTEDTTFLEKN